MDLTKEEIEFILESIQLGNPDPKWEALVEKIKGSDVVVYKHLDEKDHNIVHGKVCPDCPEALEYQEADPSGRDCDIYYCPECFDNPDLDGKAHKEFLIWFERRDIGVEVQEI